MSDPTLDEAWAEAAAACPPDWCVGATGWYMDGADAFALSAGGGEITAKAALVPDDPTGAKTVAAALVNLAAALRGRSDTPTEDPR